MVGDIVEIWIDEEGYFDYLQSEFEDFELAYDDAMSFDEWRFAVDVDYRGKYGTFPLLDDEMMERLPIIVGGVCLKLIDELHEEIVEFEKSEMLSMLSDMVLKRIAMYLSVRADFFDLDYPHRNRFQRHEIIDGEIKWEEKESDVNEALDVLVDKGFLKLLEHGGKAKYDTYQLVEV